MSLNVFKSIVPRLQYYIWPSSLLLRQLICECVVESGSKFLLRSHVLPMVVTSIVRLYLNFALSRHATDLGIALAKDILSFHLRHKATEAWSIVPGGSVWNQIKLMHVGLRG